MGKIKNDIKEQVCSFNVSKILTDKGFDATVSTWYNELGNFLGRTDLNKSGKTFREVYPNADTIFAPVKNGLREEFTLKCYLAPTHAVAIEWIRVNFGIWILIDIDFSRSYLCNYVVKWENGICFNGGVHKGYETPQEATEAALSYVLNNLIK